MRRRLTTGRLRELADAAGHLHIKGVATLALVGACGAFTSATSSASTTSDAVDVAVLPKAVYPGPTGQPPVQLAGTGQTAWVAWCENDGAWAQRVDLAAKRPPIPLGVDGCPVEAFMSRSGVAVVVMHEWDDESDWLRSVRLRPDGTTTVDRAVIPQQVITDLAVDASPVGAIVAYRVEPYDEQDPSVVAVTSDQNGRLSPARKLGASPGREPLHPVVAIDPRGSAIACWTEYSFGRGTPLPTMCRLQAAGAEGFGPATSVWDSRDLPLTGQEEVPLVQPIAAAFADDGTVAVLGGGDGTVLASRRNGEWTQARVLSSQRSEALASDAAARFDATGAFHAAWVSPSPDGRDLRLRAAAVGPTGDVSARELDPVSADTTLAPVMGRTSDGGVALSWVVGRDAGGPLRLATAPPGAVGFGEAADREGEAKRLSLDMDVWSDAAGSWTAVAEHLLDGAGNPTDTAAIRVLPTAPLTPRPTGDDGKQRPDDDRDQPPITRAPIALSIGKPVVSRGVVSIRVACRNTPRRCAGNVRISAGRASVSRAFSVEGTSETLRVHVRFAARAARRILAARKFTISVSARARDGRIGAASRSMRRAARR